MFFVVPVTFSDMFILNINVCFGIYSIDLIRINLFVFQTPDGNRFGKK